MTDMVVVGAGLFGLTVAERAASKLGIRVQVIDRRPHIGGNAYSSTDPDTGIEVHDYGSHIFHTVNEKVWAYANTFTAFTPYVHRVYAHHGGTVYPLPINLGTINQFFNAAYSPTEARALLQSQAEQETYEQPSNFEEKAVSLIGRPLYEAFIAGYTEKQWQTDPRQLPAEVISRLPVRFTYNNQYFDDRYQGIPVNGYTAWLSAMADHPRIDIQLATDFFDNDQPFNRSLLSGQTLIVYTAPLDQFFDYRLGRLSWRTLDFEREVIESGDHQGTSVMNYCDLDHPYTRVHEFRHLHPERNWYPSDRTVIAREYSRFAQPADEPYYPVNTPADQLLAAQYRDLQKETTDVVFGGRLGTYRYLDMHMAIAAALKSFNHEIVPLFRRHAR